MPSVEIRIRKRVEKAVEAILDDQAQGNTVAQTRDYISRLRTVADALRQEAQDIEALVREEAGASFGS